MAEATVGLLPPSTAKSDGVVIQPDAVEAPKMPSATIPDKQKIDKYLSALTDKAGDINPKLASCMSAMQPFIVVPIQVVSFLAPYYLYLYQYAYAVYTWLPKNAVLMLFGFALCFFGGTYVASIAAIEAFRQMGFAKVLADVAVVQSDLQTIAAANKMDDEKDKDGDGVPDVEQSKPSDLAQRKVFVVLKAIQQPDRLQMAVGSLWAAYIAVLATLKLEFARTTAFALGIVDVVKAPVVRVLSPLVVGALMSAPEDMRLKAEATKAWSVTIIESLLTLVAVIFAWYLQMIISAFYSGLRGGRMFADALVQLLFDYDLMKYVPLVAQPFDPEESYMDEVVGYSVAALGFSFQFFAGFMLPFPLNIIFFPLSLIEWFLRIQISFESAGVY